MTATAEHKVHIYPDAATARRILASGNILHPTETLVFADLDSAIAKADAVMTETGDPCRADIMPDPDHCSLEDYIRAVNHQAERLAAQPQSGTFRGLLADAAFWRESHGIATARALDDHLFLETFSDHYKELCGTRPPSMPRDRAEAERLLANLVQRAA